MPHLLELFSGTGSIGKAFAAAGWTVTSLDVEEKFSPTILSDIMAWDYRALPRNSYDFVWASCPCTHYSIARTTAKTPRDLEGSDAMVQRVLDIIAYFKPFSFCIENPATGLLKTRDVIRGIAWIDVSYCKFGYPYKKQTRFWTNLHLDYAWDPPRACCKASPCRSVRECGHHPCTAQRGPGRLNGSLRVLDRFELTELYSIPPALCVSLAAAATSAYYRNM